MASGYDFGMGNVGGPRGNMRIVILSALSAFIAPLVFVSIIALRKAERRIGVHARIWNQRLQHEIARWS